MNAIHEPLSEEQREVSDWFFNELRQNREVVEKIETVRKWRTPKIRAMANRKSDDRKKCYNWHQSYERGIKNKLASERTNEWSA